MSRALCDGRSARRLAQEDENRGQTGALRLRRRSHDGQGNSTMGSERPLNRLVTNVADLAGPVRGAGMVMPDAAERHGNREERQQRH